MTVVYSKNEFKKRARIRTDEWISRLSLLKTGAGEAGVAARINAELRIADFREALEGFQAKMKQIEEADDRKWEAQRTDADNAFFALEDTFKTVSWDIKKMIRDIPSDDESSLSEGEDEWDH